MQAGSGVGRPPLDGAEQEVRRGRIGRQPAQRADVAGQGPPLLHHLRGLRQQFVLGVDRRPHRDLGRQVDVVGLLDAQQHRRQVGVEDAVARPQPGQPRPLAERAEDDQARVVAEALQRRRAGVLAVGLVDGDRRAAVQQRRQLVVAERRAAGVVGRGQDHQRRLGPDGGQHRLHVDAEVGPPLHLVEGDRRHVAEEAVHAEGRRATHHALPRPHQRPHRQLDQLVRPRPRHDPLRRHAGVARQRRPQVELQRVGVDRPAPVFGHGALHGVARAERVLVGVELEHVGHVHARPRRQLVDGRHRLVAGQGGQVRPHARGIGFTGHALMVARGIALGQPAAFPVPHVPAPQRSLRRTSRERAWACNPSACAIVIASSPTRCSRSSPARSTLVTLRKASTCSGDA